MLVMVVAMPETSDPREAGSGTLGVGT
jgi:hypothetical protein